MAGLRYCAKARKEAKGYDRLSIELVSLLRLPVKAGQTAAIISRVSRLTRLFHSAKSAEAAKLLTTITSLDNPIGRFFKCELSTKLRNSLVNILEARKQHAQEVAPAKRTRHKPAIFVVSDGESPLVKSRYVDNLATHISIRIVLVEWILIWRRSGKEYVANVPRKRMSKGETETLLWATKIFSNETEALKEARRIEEFNAKNADAFRPQVITFYRGDGNSIRPTLYTAVTAPRLFNGIKTYIEDGHLRDSAGLFIAYFEVVKDQVNPYFFDLNEDGEVSVTGVPKMPKMPKLNFSKVNGIRKIRLRKHKPSVLEFLSSIKIRRTYTSRGGRHKVYETESGQIIGSYKALEWFRHSRHANGKYKGWDRHHIVERRHLKALGVEDNFPGYDDLPCVLLPKKGHSQRISGELSRALPSGEQITDVEVFVAYAQAYTGLGNYTGLGANAIQLELKRIVADMLELN